jgi:hypothetical protein
MVILTAMEQAALKALADACDYSLHAHVPTEAVTCKVKKHLRGDMKEALKKLVRLGFCIKHPTGRSTTWSLTPEGLAAAKAF